MGESSSSSSNQRQPVVRFDRTPTACYYAGETLTGTVNLSSHTMEVCSEIVLRVKGINNVQFNEIVRSGSRDASQVVFDKKVLLEHEQTLWKTTEGFARFNVENPDEDRAHHQKGPGVFPFSFELPRDLPSSFQRGLSYVRYEATACTKQRRNDEKYPNYFTVIAVVDLNSLPEITTPISATEAKNIYSALSLSMKGEIRATVELPRRGFVSGQSIPIQCLVANMSKVDVEKIKVYLLQIVEYSANRPIYVTRTETKRVYSEKVAGVSKKSEKAKDLLIYVPSLPPSTVNHSCIIRINYAVEVKLKTPSMRENLSVRCPITIGSIPLMPQVENSNSAPIGWAVPDSGVRFEPPRYEEKDRESEANFDGFAPVYPLYPSEKN